MKITNQYSNRSKSFLFSQTHLRVFIVLLSLSAIITLEGINPFSASGQIKNQQNKEPSKYRWLTSNPDLHSIWINKKGNSGWIVGQNGTIYSLDEKTWKPHPQSQSLTAENLNSIWMKEDESKGWAVGNNGTLLLFNGKNWELHKSSGLITQQHLKDIAITPNGNSGWIVGSKGTFLSLNKEHWVEKKFNDIKANLISISLDEKGNYGLAVGNGRKLFQMKPDQWEEVPVPKEVKKNGVKAVTVSADGKEAWVLGERGFSHFQNNKLVPMPWFYIEGKLEDIWMNADNSKGFAVGGKSMIFTYDKDQWIKAATFEENVLSNKMTGVLSNIIEKVSGEKRNLAKEIGDVKIASGPHLRSVALTSSGKSGWAVGDKGALFYFDGKEWIPNNLFNTAIPKGGFNDLWVKDDLSDGWGLTLLGLYRYNGTTWDEFEVKDSNNCFKSIWMHPSGNKGVMFGCDISIYNFNGKSWERDERSEDKIGDELPKEKFKLNEFIATLGTNKINNIYGVWVSQDGKQGWAVGKNGIILKFDGSRWGLFSKNKEFKNVDLNDVWANENGKDGWIVGENGKMLRFNGKTWELQKQLKPRIDLKALWMKSDGSQGWAMGKGIIEFDGKEWVIRKKSKGRNFINVNRFSMFQEGKRGWAVGGTGRIYFFNGQNWDEHPDSHKAATGNIKNLWINSAGDKGGATGFREAIILKSNF